MTDEHTKSTKINEIVVFSRKYLEILPLLGVLLLSRVRLCIWRYSCCAGVAICQWCRCLVGMRTIQQSQRNNVPFIPCEIKWKCERKRERESWRHTRNGSLHRISTEYGTYCTHTQSRTHSLVTATIFVYSNQRVMYSDMASAGTIASLYTTGYLSTVAVADALLGLLTLVVFIR